MLNALGASAYHPEVGRWNHKTSNGWNVQLQREHLNLSRGEVKERLDKAIHDTCDEISNLLKRRLAQCRATLETITQCGAETAEEQDGKERLLFEFWALSRALERNPCKW